MAAKYWIKLYHEILRDRKMATLDDRLWRRVIECFLLAGEVDEEGYLPPLADVAWAFRVDIEQIETEMNELTRLGILSNIDGRFYVTKFVERQATMPKAEYMRRLRKDKQADEYYQPDTPELPNSYQSVTNGNTDKIRIDKIRGEEIRGEADNPQPFSQLQTAFINASGIPDFGMNKRAVEAGRRMVKAGVTPEDITQSIEELGDNYTIKDLASVETAAYNVKRKRLGKGSRAKPSSLSVIEELIEEENGKHG